MEVVWSNRQSDGKLPSDIKYKKGMCNRSVLVGREKTALCFVRFLPQNNR